MTDCPTLSYTTTCTIPTLSLQCRIQTEEIGGSREEGTGGAVIQILRKGEKGGPGQQKNFSALCTLVWSKNRTVGGGALLDPPLQLLL